MKVLNYFCRQCFDKNPGQFNMKGKSELDNGGGKKAVTAGAVQLHSERNNLENISFISTSNSKKTFLHNNPMCSICNTLQKCTNFGNVLIIKVLYLFHLITLMIHNTMRCILQGVMQFKDSPAY